MRHFNFVVDILTKLEIKFSVKQSTIIIFVILYENPSTRFNIHKWLYDTGNGYMIPVCFYCSDLNCCLNLLVYTYVYVFPVSP